MANLLIGYQNRTDENALGRGVAVYLASRQPTKPTRPTRRAVNGATLAATKFDMDFGSAKAIGVVALVVHNMSVTGKVPHTGRRRGQLATPTYDSGWIEVWARRHDPAGSVELGG